MVDIFCERCDCKGNDFTHVINESVFKRRPFLDSDRLISCVRCRISRIPAEQCGAYLRGVICCCSCHLDGEIRSGEISSSFQADNSVVNEPLTLNNSNQTNTNLLPIIYTVIVIVIVIVLSVLTTGLSKISEPTLGF